MPRFIYFYELYKALADSPATVKLLLVDACRNELLAQPEGRPGGIAMPAPPPPPASVAALFSCSEKEVSWEDSELDGGHGVFFHYVIQGFSGKADEWERGNHNHKVELYELYSYVKDNVLAFVAHKHFTAQRPRLVGELGPVDLLDISTRSSGRYLVTTRVGQIKLKRIPARTFQMGSPAGEGSEDEHPQHEVRITRPFYLGVTEVSQAQYEAVMGNNPSDFSAAGGGKDKVAGQSTGELPVETVSWLDAVKFCNKLSELEGRRPFYEIAGETVRVPDWKASGYRLPTRPSGNTRAGAIPRTSTSTPGSAAIRGPCPIRRGRSLQTGLASTTCSATSVSGAGTLTTRITTSSRRATIRPDLTPPRPRAGWSGAGAGASSRGTAGRRTVKGSRPSSSTAALGFRLALVQ